MSLLKTAFTIEDLACAIEGGGVSLPDAKAKRIAGDLRLIARWCGRTPEELPARLRDLRPLIADLHPARIGISAGRLANVRTSVRKAFELMGQIDNRPRPKQHEHLPPAWKVLREALAGTWMQSRLDQFMRFCAEAGVGPAEVDAETFAAWGRWRESGVACLAADPHKAVRQGISAWNRAVATVPGWAVRRIEKEDRRRVVNLPLEAFPPSFGADIERFRARVTRSRARRRRLGASDYRYKPLSARSVDRRVEAIRLAATALVEAGEMEAAQITRVADVATPEAADLMVLAMEERNRDLTEYALSAVKGLRNVASRLAEWGDLELDEDDRDAWRDLFQDPDIKALRPKGIGRRNRERLAQFHSDANIAAVLSYPYHTAARLEAERKAGRVTIDMAREMAAAVAVLLLQTLPVRRANLASIDMTRHLRAPLRRRENGLLSFPEEEVKNQVALEAALSPEKWALVETYRRHYRPRLCHDAAANPHLFPAREGDGHASPASLGVMIGKRLYRATGVRMNLHLWRHFIASLWLRDHPGKYDVVRALLGHANNSQTTRRYAELEVAAAAALSDGVVERNRSAVRRAKPRKERRWKR